MSKSIRRPGPDDPSTAATEAHQSDAPATRMIIEGDDALEKVASLLRSGGTVGNPGRLEALADAIRSRRPDLSGDLLREVDRMADTDAATALLLSREGHDPVAFMAGAVIGFALGAGGLQLPQDDQRPSDEPGHPADAQEGRGPGVVENAQDAQTGSGGLGSLDTGHPPDGRK